MFRDRNEYRRQWMAKKRKRMRMQRAADRSVQLSSESDASHSKVKVASHKEVVEVVCDDALMHSSDGTYESDFASHSHELNWNSIDLECDKQYLSDSSDSNDEGGEKSLTAELQSWAVDNHVTHVQLDQLLCILNRFHSELPLTAKTLLKIQQIYQCRSLSGGDYIYFGVADGLLNIFGSGDTLLTISEIELAFNIDGVPIFSSSSYSLWPVLCYATNILPHRVFVVALFGGKSKPCDLKFLDEVVDEMKQLMVDGMEVKGKKLKCIVKMCVCDAVARAMVKSIKQFSGYYGCDKCCQKGKYIGRMTYPECNSPLRTDASFRSRTNADHHTGDSPFSSLPVDMIVFFPIDYMHQVCLGVMKRLLICWTSGPKKVKLSFAQKQEINAKICDFRAIVTKEFTRKPRSLSELPHWKATEYRTFLLYAGYFVLRKTVQKDIFEHFICLSVAVGILLSEKLSADEVHRQFAHDLLVYFVSKSAELYGEEFLVYNVHSLTHLSEEVKHFGKLDNSSAFIFENYMQHVKRSVRSARNPVLQVIRRLQEKTLYSSLVTPVLNLSCALENYCCKPPDNSCILEDGRCCQVISFGNEQVTCMVFAHTEPLYLSPCDSRILGKYKVRLSTGVLKFLPRHTTGNKAMCYTDYVNSELVFIQLLHTV